MHMIGDTINDDGFLAFVFDDAIHIFENLVTPGYLQKVGAAFHCKDSVEVDLRECSSPCAFPLISPRWGSWMQTIAACL